MDEEYKQIHNLDCIDLISSCYDKARGLYANNISEDVLTDLDETISLEYKLREEKRLS